MRRGYAGCSVTGPPRSRSPPTLGAAAGLACPCGWADRPDRVVATGTAPPRNTPRRSQHTGVRSRGVVTCTVCCVCMLEVFATLVGLALHASKNTVDRILKGARLHP